MIWKGLGILTGTAALVVVGVVGLAWLTIPDEVTFAESVEEARDSENGFAEFLPTTVGGELSVTGAFEGAISLDRQVSGPSYGLGNSQARVFFETDPLTIDQMSFEGLAFFPEAGDCEFTPGQHNEETGLVAVEISCPELVDIRDNGSIALSGFAALPADMVLELDLPERGGTVSIGDETITFGEDLHLFVGPTFQSGGGGHSSEIQLTAVSDAPQVTLGFPYDLDSGLLRLGRVAYSGGSNEIGAGECSHDLTELAVINPQSRILQLDFSCDDVQLANIGTVPIEGTLVFEQLFFADEH